MKQTNNAIKSLMAQYRAIFKNANIAMVAAMAAAALSAGQAQAAADGNLEAAEWEQALKDGNGTITITGAKENKGEAGKFQNLKHFICPMDKDLFREHIKYSRYFKRIILKQIRFITSLFSKMSMN